MCGSLLFPWVRVRVRLWNVPEGCVSSLHFLGCGGAVCCYPEHIPLSRHSLKGPHSHTVTVAQMVVSLCLGRAGLGLCTCPASPHILPGGSGGSTSEVVCRPDHHGEWGADPLIPAVYWTGFYQNEVLHLPIHLFICFSVCGSLLACLGAISSHRYHSVPGLSLQAGS